MLHLCDACDTIDRKRYDDVQAVDRESVFHVRALLAPMNGARVTHEDLRDGSFGAVRVGQEAQRRRERLELSNGCWGEVNRKVLRRSLNQPMRYSRIRQSIAVGERHVRLHVEDGRAVHEVDAAQVQRVATYALKLHQGEPNRIWPVRRSRGEETILGAVAAQRWTFDLVAAFPLRWKTKTIQTCEKASSPSSACAALRPLVKFSLRVAAEEGHTQPCRGVPFFSTKIVCSRPMGRARKRSSSQIALGA